jgi:hypothetical protein
MYIKKGIIDRFEEDKAIIKTEDGQTLFWNQAELPTDFHEGTPIVLEIKPLEEIKRNQEELAKKILAEIFQHETIVHQDAEAT